MNICKPFILRPIATSLMMAAILLMGVLAYRLLAVSALPQVDYPTIQIVTLYPGASPDVTASSITSPMERQFGQIPGLSQMSSTSSGGASIITLQFNLNVAISQAEQEVQAAINAANTFLPADLPTPPIYSKVNPADTPVLTLAVTSKNLPLATVQPMIDTRVVQKLSQLPGVGLVSLSGGQRPAVRIQVDPSALAARGLTMDTVRTVIGTANVNQAKGSFDGAAQASSIDANDQLRSADEYRKLVIAYQNGAPIVLGDVTTVIDGAENTQLAAWANRDAALLINVQRQPGANVIEVINRIHAALPDLQRSLPDAVTLKVLSDRSITIRASVRDVQFELMLAIALVVMVIFVFLRNLSATLIPSVAVPLSLIGTFAVMYAAGFSINNLTLMALTIATGFVVDDAIVMIENIARYLEEGESPLQAALKGSEQIAFTIVSLTFSLIAVLIPLLFMQDVVGRLFREFAITLAVAILISAVVSLTLTPMLCARWLRHTPEQQQGRFYRQTGAFFDALIARYGRLLQWVLRHQPLTLMVAAATLALTVALYLWIPKGFFPVQDTGVLQGISEAPAEVSFSAMAVRQQALTHILLQDPAVSTVSSFIGVDGLNPTLNTGRLLIDLKPHEERHETATAIRQRLQTAVAHVSGIRLYLQPVQDLSIEDRISRTQYQFSLSAVDPALLSEWTPKVLERLQGLSSLADVATDSQPNGLQAYVDIDRDTAGRLGVSVAAIDEALYNAFGQRLISTIFTQSNQYRVVLEVKPEFKNGLASLNQLYVSGANNQPVPLSSLIKVETRQSPLLVTRMGQLPAASLSFNLAPGVALGDAVKEIQAELKSLQLPAAVEVRFQGAALAFEASLSHQLLLIAAAIITMYIVLGVLYESYIHPITILSTLPSAAVGALLAIKLSGDDINLVAIIGIILLIGIVKKNAIMMIDFALEAERNQGLSARDAIYQACLLRFRPILMTTLAALLGALPLMLGTGVGAELRHPLGVTMVGGLMVSQVLTLFTTPVIYLGFDRLGQRFRKWRNARGSESTPSHLTASGPLS